MIPADKNAVSYRAADMDGIPVVWIQPEDQDGDARIALWLPWLTGTKETTIPFLAELARRGFTAVSFDLWQHGERATETAEQIAARVFGGSRRHMWPILGQTTLDALRVADRAARVVLGATCAPPSGTAVTPSNRAGRHWAARHGRRWADPAGRRHELSHRLARPSAPPVREASCDRPAGAHQLSQVRSHCRPSGTARGKLCARRCLAGRTG
jgi:hypothetical protein